MVWGAFIAATTLVIAVLNKGGPRSSSGYLLASLDVVGADRATAHDAIFQTATPLDRARWTGIVVHHSGTALGDAETMHRQHLAQGFDGLGYHFLIGNGQGLGDGVIHVGYRWDQQKPGAHVAGARGAYHNEHSIGICMIGNGDRRPFTELQMRSLISLVERLQRELAIDAAHVYEHRDLTADLSPMVSSPGRYFDRSRFTEELDAAR